MAIDETLTAEQAEYIDELELYDADSTPVFNLPNEIDVREDPQSVFEWMRKYKGNRLITDPDFQRNIVWKPEQRSRFIESVLMGIPLPPLYVNQTLNGLYMLVDGLQRTTTLYDYIEKRSFALDEKLKVLTDARGKRFNELPPLFQSRIEDKKMLVYIIKPSVDIRVVYDIFDRINSGGTQLTRQEVRNCYYSGKSTKLLKELATSEVFKRATAGGIPDKRMRDREAVLRCLAFQIRPIAEYRNDMDDYLRSTMDLINNFEEARLSNIAEQFGRTMKAAWSIFSDACYRIPTPTTKGPINVAVMESVYLFLSQLSDDQLINNGGVIVESYRRLLQNQDYLQAVTRSTGATSRVAARFRIAREILGDGLC